MSRETSKPPAPVIDFSPLIDHILAEVTALRHELHAHPELSFKEHNTSRRVREQLEKLPHLQVLPALIETDVVAVLNAGRDGPCIALRADMDALPVVEETEVEYRSTVPGVMHACGHDGHTAVLVGTAMVLSQVAETLPGKVKFIFQPAEEEGGGGEILCQRGVLDAPRVDAAVALHSWPGDQAGTITINNGPVTAANNEIVITVRGRGGHGAYPHRCTDPILAAAHIITALQSIVSRNVPPLDSGVVTLGQITAGSISNVIPPECFMRGTIRYYRPETGEMIRERARSIAENTARACGAEADVQIRLGYPPMFNDPGLTEVVIGAARQVLGPERVITTGEASMGAEDFGFYAQRVPAVMMRLGMRPPEQAAYPGLHNPGFNFNDAALPTGIGMFCAIAQRYLNSSP